ncbi:hypothetical protein SAMN05446635_6664 [Burkholderia sp. OK233]|nr:hypothetical protein SAMN05446635_6664 [Burkholderia sp. OK233]
MSTQPGAFATPRRTLSQSATAGKVGASGRSWGDVQRLGLLGQKFSDNRRKAVQRTGRGKISLGRSGYALASTRPRVSLPAWAVGHRPCAGFEGTASRYVLGYGHLHVNSMRYLAGRLDFRVTPKSNDQDSWDSASFGAQALNVPIVLQIAQYSGAAPTAEWWLLGVYGLLPFSRCSLTIRPDFQRRRFPPPCARGTLVPCDALCSARSTH